MPYLNRYAIQLSDMDFRRRLKAKQMAAIIRQAIIKGQALVGP